MSTLTPPAIHGNRRTEAGLRACIHCGVLFAPLTLLHGAVVSVCCSDQCVDAEKAKRRLDKHGNPLRHRPIVRWQDVCPPRYAFFKKERLPPRALSIADEVLAFDPNRTPGHGVAIVGASDSGKSMLIHEAAHRAFDLGHEVFVTCATEFSWKVGDLDRRQAFVQRCMNAPILVFDDVGKGRLTDRVEADFFHLLDHRERWRLPLIWSANSKGDTLRQAMTTDRADPIINRLRRSAKVFAI